MNINIYEYINTHVTHNKEDMLVKKRNYKRVFKIVNGSIWDIPCVWKEEVIFFKKLVYKRVALCPRSQWHLN